MPKLNECPENVRCSNISGAMHNLLVGECLTGAKSVRWQKCFGLYLLKQGRSHRCIHVMALFKVVKASEAISEICSDAHSITLKIIIFIIFIIFNYFLLFSIIVIIFIIFIFINMSSICSIISIISIISISVIKTKLY